VTSGLLVCVICGHVGCGGLRRSTSHARQHFFDTYHAYALEIGTQQVVGMFMFWRLTKPVVTVDLS
jgi:uncharacterized UBP type Zn finger protein